MTRRYGLAPDARFPDARFASVDTGDGTGPPQKRSVWRGAVAGLLGGLAGAFVMNKFQELASRAGHGREAPDAAPGGARTGRGPQPAQAETNADDDATVKLATAVNDTLGREPLNRGEKLAAGRAAHYAFGAANGLCYGAAAEIFPWARASAGIPFGLAIWGIADEGIVPAMGLSRGPRQLSARLIAFGCLSHCLFGLTTEAVRRALRGGQILH